MSLFLIILAAGDSKRLRSATPKPFHKINNMTLLEHTINSFKNVQEIKKTVIVFNKKLTGNFPRYKKPWTMQMNPEFCGVF